MKGISLNAGLKTVLLFSAAMLCASSPANAMDNEYDMMHNGQNAFVVGVVERIMGDGITIAVRHRVVADTELPGKEQIAPETVTLENVRQPYTFSYHDYPEQRDPQEGDCVLASLDQVDGAWEIAYGMFEVSSADYGTLDVLPLEKISPMSFLAVSLKAFVNSDGTKTEFGTDDTRKIVTCDGEIIFDYYSLHPRESQLPAPAGDPSPGAADGFSQWGAVLAGLLAGAAAFAAFRRRRRHSEK